MIWTIWKNQKKNDSNDVLDGMLEACDYMMDLIDESARNKYVRMQADKQKKDRDEMYREYSKADSYPDDDIEAHRHFRKGYDIARRLQDKNNSTVKYINGRSLSGDSADLDKEIQRSRVYSNKYNHIGDYDRKKAGERFKKDFGGPGGEDKLAAKRPGSVLAAQEQKKKAVKETCLNILAALDDID